jgi:hypothetical protein
MREQNEAALNLDMLAGAIERVREMLARLAPPQRTQVAKALLPSVEAAERCLAQLRKFIDEVSRDD